MLAISYIWLMLAPTHTVACPLYREVPGWLMNVKLKVNMEYVLAHSAGWWNRNFQWAQSAPPWMVEELPVYQQLGGCRVAELPVMAMLLRWYFLKLDVAKDERFSKWRELRDKLPSELQERANLQDIAVTLAFRRAAIEIQAKHFERSQYNRMAARLRKVTRLKRASRLVQRKFSRYKALARRRRGM